MVRRKAYYAHEALTLTLTLTMATTNWKEFFSEFVADAPMKKKTFSFTTSHSTFAMGRQNRP